MISYYSLFINNKNLFLKPEQIVENVLQKTGIKKSLLLSKTRNIDVVFARHAISLALEDHLVNKIINLTEAAELTGRTNHASVLHSIKKAKLLIETKDQKFKTFLL